MSKLDSTIARMDLRHLRYFIAVAEELSFTRAARRVETAQPSLSRQIQQLEEMLGGKLFIRNRKSVALTKAGRAFLNEAKQVMIQCNAALNVARHALKEESDEITIAVSPVAELGLLPRLLPRLHSRFPNIRVSLKSLRFASQVDAVRTGNVHAGFCCMPNNELSRTLKTFAHVEEIYKEPVLLALPAGHPLASAEVIPLDRVFDEEMLVVPCPLQLSVSFDQLKTLAGAFGTAPRFIKETDNITSALSLISAGLCVGFLPACAQSIGGFQVVYRKIGMTYEMPPMSLIAPRQRKFAAVDALRQLVAEFLDEPPRLVAVEATGGALVSG